MAPGGRRIAAVLLPREHLPFIRSWLEHHLTQGWQVTLYLNQGSVGSARKTSHFHRSLWIADGQDKRGFDYTEYSAQLSDDEVLQRYYDLAAELGFEAVLWQPRDHDGQVIHGQVEAYVDFVVRYRGNTAWGAFIDADEYLRLAPGVSWDALLSEAVRKGCHRLQLEGLRFPARWDTAGNPLDLSTLPCLGAQDQGSKNLLFLDQVVHADVHWDWFTAGENLVAKVDRGLAWFEHYNSLEPPSLIKPIPAPGLTSWNEGLPVPTVLPEGQA